MLELTYAAFGLELYISRWQEPDVGHLLFFWFSFGRCWYNLGNIAALKLGIRTDRPDRLHFHQLIVKLLKYVCWGAKNDILREPVCYNYSHTLISIPQLLGVVLWDQYGYSLVGASVGLLFVLTYLLGINLAKKPFIASKWKHKIIRVG